jgi:CPA1 family monovalent cation:H+ antiporter
LSAFHLFAAVISLAALAGYVNYRLLRLPTAIGMMLTVLAFSATGVAMVLLARLVGVAAPIGMLRATRRFAPGTIRMLTWGGLKGGISIALALSLPEFVQRDLFLAATYAVVVFSVLVQGLTLGPLARRIAAPAENVVRP